MDQASQIPKTFRPFSLISILKVIFLALALIVVLFYLKDFLDSLVFPIFGLILVISILKISYMYVEDHCHSITIQDGGLKYCKGILSKKQTFLPSTKITESSSTQSLFERIFGFGTLKVDTPGGSDLAVEMHNMKYSDIKTILDYVDKKDG